MADDSNRCAGSSVGRCFTAQCLKNRLRRRYNLRRGKKKTTETGVYFHLHGKKQA